MQPKFCYPDRELSSTFQWFEGTQIPSRKFTLIMLKYYCYNDCTNQYSYTWCSTLLVNSYILPKKPRFQRSQNVLMSMSSSLRALRDKMSDIKKSEWEAINGDDKYSWGNERSMEKWSSTFFASQKLIITEWEKVELRQLAEVNGYPVPRFIHHLSPSDR